MPTPADRERVLACPSLPTPPVIAVKLLELTRDPEVRISDIAKLVESDQALAGKVIRLVNSSLYSLTSPCKSIERALSLLGLSTVKSLVLGFSLVEATKSLDDDDGFDTDAYWTRVIYGASAARIVADKTRAGDPDESFTAALFQDMGMLASYIALQAEYAQLLSDAPKQHEKLTAHENETLGFNHAQIGAELAIKWKLPESLADSIRHHHKPADAPSTVYNACRVVELGRMAAEAIGPGCSPATGREFAARMREDFDMAFRDVDELLMQVADAATAMATMFEKSIGEKPDVHALMAEAQELQMEHQLTAARETEQLKAEAMTDGLTGAHNRKRFDQELAAQMEHAKTSGEPLALLFLDADRFKSVNDTHGHQAGDAVLVELARRLNNSVGQYGMVFRYGGEEFAALVPNMNSEKAARQGELARSTIAGSAFNLRDVEGAPDLLPVTVSVGVALFDPAAEASLEGDILLKRADEQVYKAKEGGRNTVRVHGVEGEPEETANAKTPTAKPKIREGLRVMLVEDDALAATLVRVVLAKRKGVQVEWVRDGEAAIAKLAEVNAATAPDLLITDFHLPGASGAKVVESLKTNGACECVASIVITASPDELTERMCTTAGASLVADKEQIAINLPKWLDGALSSISKAA